MTKYILKRDFIGCSTETNDIYPRQFRSGTECPPSLVEAAKSLGILEEVKEETKQIKKTPENKMLKGKLENKGE